MKNYKKYFPKIITAVMMIIAISIECYAQRGMLLPDSITANFYKEVEVREKYWDTSDIGKRRGGFKQFSRWKHFWESRIMPDGSYPNQKLLLDAWKIIEEEAKKRNNNMFLSAMPQWKEIGPTEDPEINDRTRRIYMGVGRLNVVKVHPNNPQEIWVGSAAGGAWVSKNGGASWNVLYQTEFLSLGVSDITFAPSNPQTIYIATGDVYGSITSTSTYSIGIIKSTNGGLTWEHTGYEDQLSQTRMISRIWVHPTDENTVIATTSSGIIKSVDGGITWETKFSGHRFMDLEQMPNNPTVLYASSSGTSADNTSTVIVRTTDGGESWHQILRINGSRRTCIEVTPAAPAALYALSCNSRGGFHSLMISDNQGDSWNQTNMYSASRRNNYLAWYADNTGTAGRDTATNGQGWYDLSMAVNPTNPNQIFIGGINIWRSNNRGTDFSIVAHWNSDRGVPYVHADVHDLRFQGSNRLYAAHDGGLDVTTNSGSSWTPLNKGLAIAQLYRFSNSRQNPNNMIIGLQDLGTRIYENSKWYYVYGGDGMDCAFDPLDDRRMYYSVYYGDIFREYNGNRTRIINPSIIRDRFGANDSGAWVTPLVVSPINPQKIYVGYSNIYFSNDRGTNWQKQTNWGYSSSSTFRNMRISEKDDNYIYAAKLRELRMTRNGGANWLNIQLPTGAASFNITGVAIHPNDPEIVYITFSGYNARMKLFKYDGNEWTNLSGNLPNVPANCVELHYANDKLNIYVGTDIGVYHAANDFPYFKRWGEGLPNLYISQLEVVPSLQKLRAASFGRGVWEIDLNTCSLEHIAISSNGVFEFCTNDSLRLFVDTDGQGDIFWSTGETTNEIWVKESGRYWAASNANSDCPKISNFIDIEEKFIRSLTVNVNGIVDACIGDTVTITARSGFTSYQWFDENAGSNVIDTGISITVTTSGEYFVLGVNENDCISKSPTTSVKMYPQPEQPYIYMVHGEYNEAEPEQTFDTLFVSAGVRFIWYRNGVRINGATTNRLLVQRTEANEDVEYTCSIALEGSCFSEQSEPFLYTNIAEIDFVAFNIIPNPARNKFTIELNERFADFYSISIIDLQGIRVFSIANILIDSKFDVDINHLAKGTYLLNIVSGSNNFTRKFIKE